MFQLFRISQQVWAIFALVRINTAWKLSKHGVISGPYFTVFSSNTGKCGPKRTPYLDNFHVVGEFSHSSIIRKFNKRKTTVFYRLQLLTCHIIFFFVPQWKYVSKFVNISQFPNKLFKAVRRKQLRYSKRDMFDVAFLPLLFKEWSFSMIISNIILSQN